ncbi:MAG: M16 family metallopeptidase [Gammaproteobacteria bacterium]
MIFSTAPRKNRYKKWILGLSLIVIASVSATLFVWWRGHQEPTPTLLLNTGEETHVAIEEWTTKHGMKVLLVSTDALPILDMRLIFAAGSARDGQLPGLAELSSQVLLQGSQQFDAEQIAERIDAAGSSIDTSINRDMMAISMRVLSTQELFDQAFKTLLAILSKPTFPPDVVIREQQRLISNLQEQQHLPSVIASNNFYSALYRDHPYAHPVMGTLESVSKITQQDVAAFAAQYYSAENAVLALVGDIDLENAKALADVIEASLPAGVPASALPTPEPLAANAVLNIPFDSTQAHVLYGTLGINRDDPDFFPLYVGNHILGGSGLVSMLFKEVRKERGLAYNTTSQLIPLQQTGPFIINAQTRTEATEEVIAVLQHTVQDFINQGPTQEQVQAAQSNITGNFALRLDSNAAVVDQLAMIAFYDLPPEYLASFRAQILAVTPEQVKTAMQKHLNLNNSVLVTVGYAP